MQIMQELNPICINCMVNSRLNQYPENASEKDKADYMMRVINELALMKNQQDPTIATSRIIKLQQEMFGTDKNYKKLKSRFNQFIMDKEAFLIKEIHNADDSLRRAIQYSIVGNMIDFIVMDNIEEQRLEQMFLEASEYVLDEETYQLFSNELKKAKKITYLTDNCGEIVVDKLFMQVIQEFNPDVELIAIVRGSEILNDATMEDAIQVGLTDVVKVIGNGTDYAGTCLQYISDEARENIESADVVISKGQGNLETLEGCGLNLFYIFLSKCEMIAKKYNVPIFTPMLVKEE